MNLSLNFTLEELMATSTGHLNWPDEPMEVAVNLTKLAILILQPIRDRWGALQITSGFRSWAVNGAVGGSSSSQHCFGEAADFVPLDADIDNVFKWIVKGSGLQYGQCIKESISGRRWIHISLPREGRTNQEALVYDGKTYQSFVRGA
mgnify:CR=1 FL=1